MKITPQLKKALEEAERIVAESEALDTEIEQILAKSGVWKESEIFTGLRKQLEEANKRINQLEMQDRILRKKVKNSKRWLFSKVSLRRRIINREKVYKIIEKRNALNVNERSYISREKNLQGVMYYFDGMDSKYDAYKSQYSTKLLTNLTKEDSFSTENALLEVDVRRKAANP